MIHMIYLQIYHLQAVLSDIKNHCSIYYSVMIFLQPSKSNTKSKFVNDYVCAFVRVTQLAMSVVINSMIFKNLLFYTTWASTVKWWVICKKIYYTIYSLQHCRHLQSIPSLFKNIHTSGNQKGFYITYNIKQRTLQ